MKKLLFIIVAAGTLVACEKNNDSQPVDPAVIANHVKKVIYESGNSDIFSYDGAGRLTTRTSSNGEKREFEYQPGKVIEKQFNTLGELYRTYTYDVDASGLAVKEIRTSQPGFQQTVVYNSDKQKVKVATAENNNTSLIEYFYSNGNCDSTRHSSNGTWNRTVKMTYHTDKLNVIDNEVFGQYFLGKKSKNLAKSEQYFFADGTIGNIESYEYEFDAKGRVSKMIVTEDGDVFTTTYFYE